MNVFIVEWYDGEIYVKAYFSCAVRAALHLKSVQDRHKLSPSTIATVWLDVNPAHVTEIRS